MKILKENPDTVYFGDKILRNRDSDVYTFGYYIVNNKVEFLIDQSDYHGTLRDNYYEKMGGSYPERNDSKMTFNTRTDETLDGRLWTKSKVISIWALNLTKIKLEKIIKDINKKTNVGIDDNWNLEIDNGKFKKVGDYLGRDWKMKIVDPSLRYLISPMNKQKEKVDGFGSDKYDKLAKNYGFNSVAQMNYYNKNKYFEGLSLIKILNKIIC